MQAKIAVRLKGGLCNQLFQILAGYSYAKRVGKEFIIDYNLGFSASQGNHPNTYKETLFSKLKSDSIENYTIFTEKEFSYQPIPNIEGNVLLDGYFQSSKYFDDSDLDVICFDSYISRIKKILEYLQTSNNTTGIHIRGGDYLKFYKHNIITREYYLNCFKILESNERYIITDDIYYAKSLLLPNVTIIETGDEVTDLVFLSKCNNIIMSNSTFSWFAAKFSKNANVLVPDKWFRDGTDSKDIYEPRFKKVSLC